jgi:hypothetical protein
MCLDAAESAKGKPNDEQNGQKLPETSQNPRSLGEQNICHDSFFRAHKEENQEEQLRRECQGGKNCAGNPVKAEQKEGGDRDCEQRVDRGAVEAQVAISD